MTVQTRMEEQIEELRRRAPCIDLRAYYFVLGALREVGRRLPKRRHISAHELLEGVRVLAIERYGLTARMVLEHWGVTATEDIGEIVFGLVDQGVLVKTEDDRSEDFANGFDFVEAFETNYPWQMSLGQEVRDEPPEVPDLPQV
ncbi:MAG: hypothetical protein J4G12_03775 [Gemmatimonadetes bacterium]|nr:hypothetical protein [Gemmatimonadota bacterium]